MQVRLTIAAAVCLLGLPAAMASANGPVHSCAVLEGLTPPGVLAPRVADPNPESARSRLIAVRRAEVAARAREARGVLVRGAASDVRVLWGPGVVCAAAPAALWDRVAALPGVARVFADPPRPDDALLDAGASPNTSVPPEAPLVAVRAPEAWERGFTGRGVVVALIDTGVDMAHADLAHAIWINDDEVAGNGIDDDGNGYVDDVRGWDFGSNDNDPSDSAGHGTSAAGLIVGNGASGSQTGGAPGATLMVVRRGTTQAALWESSQYAIENGATIISQSTSWKWSFQPDYGSWRAQADVELALGVLHVNSSGNTGLDSAGTEPVPYNIAAPANVPPPWHHPEQSPQAGLSSVIGVGNVDAATLAIVAASPYGPTEWTDMRAHRDAAWPFPTPAEYQDYPAWGGQPGLVKPDLVAPGENSLSTARNGGYTVFGGTSAATPRVAGLLALMKESAPDATPADLSRALLSTARDLGPAGRDNRHGAGLPDVLAAIDALGPPLRILSWRVIDGGPPRGDGDGSPDAGEIVRLAITIENLSANALSDVDILLEAGDETLRVRDGYARLAVVPAGSAVETAEPHFGIEVRASACGARAPLLVTLEAGGARRVVPLVLPIGSESRTALIDADFEASAGGFTAGGTASSGAWVRAVPIATTSGGVPANPGADHGEGADTRCFVTGNGPTDANAGDVDGGRAEVRSPAQDASAYPRLELVYHRWFHGSDAEDADSFQVEARSSATAPWTLIEEVPATEATWRRRAIVLSDLVAPGPAFELRFTAQDQGADHVVEGGLDDVLLSGVTLACTNWTIPTDPPPAPLGATLRLVRAGADVVLTWESPPGGAAFGYRVQRSALAASGFTTIALPASESFTERGGATQADPGSIAYYAVLSLDAVP